MFKNTDSNKNKLISFVLPLFIENTLSTDSRKLEQALSMYYDIKDKQETKSNVDFFRHAAILGLKMGDPDEAERFAIDAAHQCIALDSQNPRWFSNAGYVFWFFKKPHLAIAMAEKAVGMAESNPVSQEQKAFFMGNLAYYYAETGRLEYKEKAKKLAMDACKIHHDMEMFDTLEFVLRVYGEDGEKIPNKVTLAAMMEDTSGYPRYESAQALFDYLDAQVKKHDIP